MSVFRKLANATASVKPELTKESMAIEEELEKIEQVDKFVHGFIDSVQKKISSAQADTEAELALWNELKEEGSEWKKDDFYLGNYMSKATQAALLLQANRAKLNDSLKGTLQQPLAKWSREDVRAAREQVKSYRALHQQYASAVGEVKKINSKPSVPLDQLQKAESERDALKSRFEKDGKLVWQSMGHVLEKGRLEAMKDLSDYLLNLLDYFRLAVVTLEKIEPDLREMRRYVSDKERGQLTEAQQLQKNLDSLDDPANAKRRAGAKPETITTSASGVDIVKDLPIISTHDVRRDKARWQVTVNARTREVQVLTEKGEKIVTLVDDLLSVIKARKNREGVKLKFVWNNKDEKIDQIVFPSQLERDLFYENLVFTKRSMLSNVQFVTARRTSQQDILKVFMGTWNMGNGIPPYDTDLNHWAPKNLFDVYVFSLQEAEYPPRPGYVSPEDDIFAWFGSHLGENYVKLAGTSLMQIRIVAWVRREHYYKITRVKTTTVATGLANVIGNKGAAALCFEYYDTRFCFVGTHLAARIDRKRLEVRNQNYRDILKGLAANGFSRNGLGDVHHEFDFLFWLGDLNYRIEMSRDEIIQKIMVSDFTPLRKNDQLHNERLAQNCFLDFEEADLNFEPTYRFNRGDRTFSEEKMREPAWCDRILWKAIPRGAVKAVEYDCCHALMTSDHSPIFGAFLVGVDLPAIPHNRDHGCRIVISDVRGYDLKPMKGSFADPYLTFQAPWLSSYVQTSVQEKTTNPNWDREEFVLFPAVTSKDFLNKRWLRVVVKDSRSMNNDMGCGVIYLEGAIGKPMKFTTRIVDKSRFHGHIQGTVQIFFGNDHEEPLHFDPTDRLAANELLQTSIELHQQLQAHKKALPPQPTPTVSGVAMQRLKFTGLTEKYYNLIQQQPVQASAVSLAPLPVSSTPVSGSADGNGPIVFSVSSGTNVYPSVQPAAPQPTQTPQAPSSSTTAVPAAPSNMESTFSYLSLVSQVGQSVSIPHAVVANNTAAARAASPLRERAGAVQAPSAPNLQLDPTIDADLSELETQIEAAGLPQLDTSPEGSPALAPRGRARQPAMSMWTGARRPSAVQNYRESQIESSTESLGSSSELASSPPGGVAIPQPTSIASSPSSDLSSSTSPALSSSLPAGMSASAVPVVPASSPAITNITAYMQQLQLQQQQFLEQQLRDRSAQLSTDPNRPAQLQPASSSSQTLLTPPVTHVDIRMSVSDSVTLLQMLQGKSPLQQQQPPPSQ